jgi:hypothetical protein
MIEILSEPGAKGKAHQLKLDTGATQKFRVAPQLLGLLFSTVEQVS